MTERQGDSISHLSDDSRRDITADDPLTTALDARPIATSSVSKASVDGVDTMRDLLTVALGNQYEIIRELGRGGMGAVYLAREKALERLVAIKVLRPELATSSDSRERFRREARIVANLSHPGILQLHTFGEVGGVWYFVMSYVRGESLADLLRRRNKLPWAEVHRILLELSDALACAHRYPVVHRDIKPANILLEAETGRAILTDFGISKLFGSDDTLTASGAVIGTPHYMSPEQTMAHSNIDERSDIYSLGAVGYRMLCGREPFSGESTAQLMYARLVKDPQPIATLNSDVPEEFAAMVMKCLARDPPKRWATATSLKEALTEIGDKAVDGLPEGVRDLPSFGPYALIWCAGWTGFALLTSPSFPERALLLLVAALVPVGLVLHVWIMGARGIGPVKLLRVALRPPEWWSMYWPHSLRRPTDIWTRLPFPARLFRIALSAFFVLVPGTILLREFLNRRGSTPFDALLIALETATVVFAAAAVAGGLWWARKRRLDATETFRLLTGSTALSTGWTSASLTRLLAPVGGRVRTPDSADAEDHARAIRELAQILPQELAHIRLTAVDLANDAVEALNRQSSDLDLMRHDASPAESDRLQLRLAALGPTRPDETGERAEMRGLLSNELELVWRMRDRLEIASDQRARRFERLRNLYAVLCEACDDIPDSIGEWDVPGKAVAACADLRRELELADA